jgi:hypothetical protein
MKRVLLIVWMFLSALVAHAAERPMLNVYIVSKDPGDGLHQADFPAFPKLGYIGEKPDLTISQLEGVSFGIGPSLPKPDGGHAKPTEDRRSLALRLTAKDAEQLNKLTAAHIGARLLLLLNNEPLVAPEIRTPSVGQAMYLNNLPRGVDTPKVKTKLETLVQKQAQPSATATPKPSA